MICNHRGVSWLFGICLLFVMTNAIPAPLVEEGNIPLLEIEAIENRLISLKKIAQDQNHWRKVFFDAPFFYKIWSPRYDRCETFLLALRKGYFQEIALIENILIDEDGNVRGYTTKKMELPDLNTSDDQGYGKIINDVQFQNTSYQEFYAHLIDATERFGLIYLDLTLGNLVQFQGKYYLIDLDSVWSIDELDKQYGLFMFLLRFLPTSYAEYLMKKVKNCSQQL